jgi:hypothetical protein
MVTGPDGGLIPRQSGRQAVGYNKTVTVVDGPVWW